MLSKLTPGRCGKSGIILERLSQQSMAISTTLVCGRSPVVEIATRVSRKIYQMLLGIRILPYQIRNIPV
jgi:hypothetical protein